MRNAIVLPDYPNHQFVADLSASLTGCSLWTVDVFDISGGHPTFVATRHGVIVEPRRDRIRIEREDAARQTAEALGLPHGRPR